jgi:hypothetical protein
MHNIDLCGRPEDFRLAFLKHGYAWDDVARFAAKCEDANILAQLRDGKSRGEKIDRLGANVQATYIEIERVALRNTVCRSSNSRSLRRAPTTSKTRSRSAAMRCAAVGVNARLRRQGLSREYQSGREPVRSPTASEWRDDPGNRAARVLPVVRRSGRSQPNHFRESRSCDCSIVYTSGCVDRRECCREERREAGDGATARMPLPLRARMVASQRGEAASLPEVQECKLGSTETVGEEGEVTYASFRAISSSRISRTVRGMMTQPVRLKKPPISRIASEV